MARKNGSRYILGHLGFTDIAGIQDGDEAVLVLNPSEPKARYEVSKNIKGAFSRAGRNCVISTQMILMESEPGTFKQGQILTVTPTAQGAASLSGDEEFDAEFLTEGEVAAPVSLDSCLSSATMLQEKLHRLFVGANPFFSELVAPELERMVALCKSLERWKSISEPEDRVQP